MKVDLLDFQQYSLKDQQYIVQILTTFRLTIIAFAKKSEEANAKCEIILFTTEYCLEEPGKGSKISVLNAKQLLELVIEVKKDSPGSLSTLEIYLEKGVSSIRNLSSSYIEPGAFDQGRYTGAFRIENPERRIILNLSIIVKHNFTYYRLDLLQYPLLGVVFGCREGL